MIAFSSPEVGLYAFINCAFQGVALTSLAADCGVEARALAMIGASAALCIAQRQGLGKFRHINVQFLRFFQGRLGQSGLNTQKINGQVNRADLLTGHLAVEGMNANVKKFRVEMREDRADTLLKIGKVIRSEDDESIQDQQCLIRSHTLPRWRLFSRFQAAGVPSMCSLISTRAIPWNIHW